MTKKKNTKPKQKVKTSHAIDSSKLSLAIKKVLEGFTDDTGTEHAGIDNIVKSLKNITVALNDKEKRNANNIIKVFGKTLNQLQNVTPEKTLTIQDMGILISK